MGFFDDDEHSSGNDAVQQQIAMNEKELEEKRQSLYTQRLDIIKSQGGQNWNAKPPAQPSRPAFGKPPDVFGIFGDRFISAAMGQARGGAVGKQPTIS